MGITVMPANPYNSSNAVGTLLGKFIGGALERDHAEKDRLETLRATEFINNMGKSYTNYDPNEQQKLESIKTNGYNVGDNPYEKIADFSSLYGSSASNIAGLQNRNAIEGISDDEIQMNNAQIFAEQEKQKGYGEAANRFRSVLEANKLSLEGFGSGDNASTNWNLLKTPLLTDRAIIPSIPNINNGTQQGINGLDALAGAKKEFGTANEDRKKEIIQYATGMREELAAKGIDYNALGLGNDGDGSQYKLVQNQDAIKGLKLTQDQLMNVQQISDAARKKAAMDYISNYNPNTFASSVTENLLKEKIDPKIIAAVQNKINDQAKNIGMQYAMQQDGVKSGDYSNAAQYAVSHGMSDVLPLFQGVANKYVTNNIDTGGSIVPTAIVSNSMGAVPKSGIIGSEYSKTLTPEGQKQAQQFTQTLDFNKDKFNKEYDLQKQQFGDNKALQWAQFQLQSNKLSLDQKEHIAGKIRAGTDIIKTKNDSLTKQLVEINKIMPINGPTPGQQYEIDLIKTEIKANNAELSKYGAAIDDNLGIKSGIKETNDPIGQWINKARAAGKTPDWIKETLKNKGYTNYDSWIW